MGREKKYYEAYEERYRRVHENSLRWFSGNPSGIVREIMEKYGLTGASKLLEIGCGEGRDAVSLLRDGWDLLAVDVSQTAVDYCRRLMPEKRDCFQAADCLKDEPKGGFDFIYAVSVLHMLVPDGDRREFYRFIGRRLNAGGIALICAIGDGEEERSSDISKAFELHKRTHEETGRELYVEGTSCRVASFPTLRREISGNDLELLESGLTAIEPDFQCVMYAVVKSYGAVSNDAVCEERGEMSD